jgi:hypothetical protein
MRQSLWQRLEMATRIGKPTYNIDDAWYVYIPNIETAEELSEWSKTNFYPAFVHCEPGTYVWDNDDGTFYKRED